MRVGAAPMEGGLHQRRGRLHDPSRLGPALPPLAPQDEGGTKGTGVLPSPFTQTA